MNDIRHYIKIVETMYHHEHVDIMFRGKLCGVEVKMYKGEMEDWSFENLGAAEHDALKLTKDDIYDIEEAIHDELEPAW